MARLTLAGSVLGVVVCAFLPAPTLAQVPVGTAFTYQGQLTDGGSPANGTYDFQFALMDAAVGGNPAGPFLTSDDVVVTNGLFTVSLDFGAAFTGSKRFLDISVRPGASGGGYTPVGPRQELTPSPSALFTSSAPWSGLTGVPAGFADGIDNDSGGDITGVTAGTGLTGGGTTGPVTLNVSFAGSGAANTAARSDHAHFGQTWSGASSSGLRIQNSNGDGLVGQATSTSGADIGVDGQSTSSIGTAVRGFATSTTGGSVGVFGLNSSSAGTGVRGYAIASSGNTIGVQGQSFSTRGTGVYGFASAVNGTAEGVYGETSSTSGIGVHGVAPSGISDAVLGESQGSNGTGVAGIVTSTAGTATGVYGQAPANGFAGFFSGRVTVTGTLSKGGGSFKIDHPLDPENKYLYHSFVESPDMMNVYNGNVVLDGRGEAVIEMPEWFEALNRDFRYQLTAIGAPGPGLHVAEKVHDNRFRIAGGSPGLEVSWQVTGIRHDAFAEAHRIPVEQDKPAEERGTYLHPIEHGMPKEQGRDYKLRPELRERPRRPPAPSEPLPPS